MRIYLLTQEKGSRRAAMAGEHEIVRQTYLAEDDRL